MSKIWELLNIDKIPKIKSKIDYKNCVGLVLNFQHKKSETIYKFRVLEYIKSYNYKGKQIHSQFKVEYIYLEKTDINVVEIKNLSFYLLRDGKVIEIPADKAQIISINNYFNNCLRQ